MTKGDRDGNKFKLSGTASARKVYRCIFLHSKRVLVVEFGVGSQEQSFAGTLYQHLQVNDTWSKPKTRRGLVVKLLAN